MNNSQFIIFLAARLGCSVEVAEQYAAAIVRWITEKTIDLTQLIVRDFGKFVVEKRNEYVVSDAVTRKRTLMPPQLTMRFVPYPLLDDEERGLFFPMEQAAGEMADKLQVANNVAEIAVVEFFKALLHAMNNEDEVSVAGLGSFQLTKVLLNNNVYGKVTFRPDNALTELVNRPFSYFQPVELNDGVQFDDVETMTGLADSADHASGTFILETLPSADTAPDTIAPTPTADMNQEEETPAPSPEVTDVPEEETLAPAPEIAESPETDEEPVVAADTQVIDTPSAEEPVSAESPVVSALTGEETAENDMAMPPKRKRNFTGVIVLLGLVALIGLFILLFGRGGEEKPGTVQQTTVSATDTIAPDTIAPDANTLTEVAPAASDTLDFDAMNAQIPYRAYDIVGIDTVITVVRGQTAAILSKLLLGADNPVYLIVANDGNDNPQPGEKYRIPKLQLRKK